MISRDNDSDRHIGGCVSGNNNLPDSGKMVLENPEQSSQGTCDSRVEIPNKSFEYENEPSFRSLGGSAEGILGIKDEDYPIVKILVNGVFVVI